MLSTDPVDWALDADGDLAFPIVRTTGVDAAAQGLRVGLQIVRGELFYDLGRGFPYFEREGVAAAVAIMGQRFNPAKVRAAYRSEIGEILSELGIDGTILRLEVDFDGATREADVTFQVGTEFGDTPVDTLALGA